MVGWKSRRGSGIAWLSLGFGLSAIAILAAVFLRPAQADGPTTWYVRPDGGSAEQCTGRMNAPYPGDGTSQPCAWDHPFRALPPGGSPRIQGGDTLVIAAGSYMMGYGASGADSCDSAAAWECHLLPIPSGPNPANSTRILGAGWEAGCPNPPELWGTERADMVLNLTDASNVQVACLVLTDHSGCVEFHTGGLDCQRDTLPYGPWAVGGIYAEDSANVRLQDLNIHGFARFGVHAGRLSDWIAEDVRIAGNGWVGWDGDIEGGSSNSGTMLFHRWTVEWNGCGESWPSGQLTGCWSQSAGGYGDGVGTGTTGGRWIIEDSIIRRNTQDGLDLLYTRLPTSSIEIRRVLAEGNAGNQVKTTGPTLIESSIVVGNCGFFEGQPFTSDVDHCRAEGNALVFALRAGNQVTVVNSTLAGEGTALIVASCALNETCNGSELVRLRNNIFQGHRRFSSFSENTYFAWYDDEPPDDVLPQNPFDTDYAIITGTAFGNVNPCPGLHNLCGVSPGLRSTSIDVFDARLLPGSPAIDAGDNSVCPTTDYRGVARPADGNGDGNAVCDIGAYEWLAEPWAMYLPVIWKRQW